MRYGIYIFISYCWTWTSCSNFLYTLLFIALKHEVNDIDNGNLNEGEKSL